MKKNTVLLDIEEYNNLRDFKQKIKEGKIVKISSSSYFQSVDFITTDEAIENIAEMNKKLIDEIEKLKNINNPKEITINELKKMSYWQIYKWRKS